MGRDRPFLGDAWEMRGRCGGDAWEMRGRCVGDSWDEVRGKVRGHAMGGARGVAGGDGAEMRGEAAPESMPTWNIWPRS